MPQLPSHIWQFGKRTALLCKLNKQAHRVIKKPMNTFPSATTQNVHETDLAASDKGLLLNL